jgi:hypothetical protein
MSEAPNYVLEAFDEAVKAHAAWRAAPGLTADGFTYGDQKVRHEAANLAAEADQMLHAAVDHWVNQTLRIERDNK